MLRTYIVYNSILLLTIIFSICVTRSLNRTSEYAYRTLLFLSQAIPMYIKKGIGTDYAGYTSMFRIIRRIDDGVHEAGFQYLARTVYNLGGDSHVFIGILGLIPLFILAYLIPKKNYNYFAIIFFLTNYLDMLGVSRQQVAIVSITLGIFLLHENKGTLKYLGCATIASLFHSSALLYFPMLLLRKLKIGPKTAFVFLAVVFFVLLGTNVFNSIFTNSLFLDSKYSIYLETDYIREANTGTGLGVMGNMLMAILFVLFFSKSAKYTELADFKCWLALLFIGSYLLASQIHIFGRLVNVFAFVPAIIAYPTCKTIYKRCPALILCGFVLMYIVLFEKMIMISQSSLPGGLGISPFKSMFD